MTYYLKFLPLEMHCHSRLCGFAFFFLRGKRYAFAQIVLVAASYQYVEYA